MIHDFITASLLDRFANTAAQLFQKGKLEKALAVYEEVLVADGTDITARLKCGDILRKLGQNDKAIAQYTNVNINWGMACALGAVLLAATLVLYAVYRRVVKSEVSLG